jgi:tRNA A58 N-methylase Trm61
MILGVILEEEGQATTDQAFYIGVGSGLLSAGISWRRSGR